jgi:4-hydroxy-tetrahydrodipicolinate synthase
VVDKRWSGVYPAVLLPFNDDYSIDEPGFRQLLQWVVGHDGIRGVVVNGHTGEINSLLPEERAEAVRIAADEVGGQVKVVSGVSAEGTIEAVAHARAVQDAGGDGILLMPPHSWLRFGRQPGAVQAFFGDVASAVDISLIVHQYPNATKAAYDTSELLDLVAIDNVEAVKMGNRDMAQYEVDVRALRAGAPQVALLTCHDEYLLPTLVQGIDGALVGFGCFVPDLIVALVRAVEKQDLAEARAVYDRIYALKQAVYQMEQPSGASHARMKEAMFQRGVIASARTRPPVMPFTEAEKADIRAGLASVGLI